MALFTIFPLAAAVKLFIAVHLLMMTLGTYLLARVLGLSIIASCVAAAAYQFSTHAIQRSSCCPVETEVLAWFPFALAGVALAVQISDRWLRAAAWGLAGLSLAQIMVAWTGQGAYYATLAVGGFIGYLTLCDPAVSTQPWHKRLSNLFIHGMSIGALAMGLAAAALLPRFEFREVSNLADGYPWDGVRGGWPTLERVIERLIGLSSYTTGAALLALALIGVVTGRRRYATPYFALLAILAAALAWRVQTPIHDFLDAFVPGFESMRQNRPERGLIVFFVPVAILAGIAIDHLPPLLARSRRSFMALVPAGLMTLLVIWLAPRSDLVGRQAALAMLVVAVILAAAVLLPLPPLRRAAPWLLTSVLLLELYAAATTAVHRDQRTGLVGSVDLNTYYDPAPAAEFLASLPDDQLFRYAGYDTDQANRRDDMLYRLVFLSESTSRIAVNNRAALIGLKDVQGGSLPMHIALYDDSHFWRQRDEAGLSRRQSIRCWNKLTDPGPAQRPLPDRACRRRTGEAGFAAPQPTHADGLSGR